MKASVKALGLICACILPACGTKKGNSSNVSVTLAKATSSLALEGVDEWITPDALALKPLAIRVGETNNGGYMVWGGLACAGEKNKKKQNDKEFEYFVENVCTSSEDNAFIDLLADIETVNAGFNSQQWPVPPGNYSWVSMIMCGPGETDSVGGGTPSSNVNNWRFQAGVMTETKDVRVCSPFSYEMATPIVVGEGGTIVLEVSYDVNQLINYYNAEASPFPLDDSNRNDYAHYVIGDDGLATGFYDPKIGVNAISVAIQ